MALIIGSILAVGAGVGSLLTYSGIKLFSDSPSKDHVQTIVKNEIAAHIDADSDHETFQNQIITILVGAVAIVALLLILYFAAIGFKTARRIRRENNNNNNNNMNAIDIEA